MKTIKQVNIKHRQNYYFYDMKNVKVFDPSLLDIDQISCKNDKFIIYDIDYTKDLNISNSLCLIFNNLDAYIEKVVKINT